MRTHTDHTSAPDWDIFATNCTKKKIFRYDFYHEPDVLNALWTLHLKSGVDPADTDDTAHAHPAGLALTAASASPEGSGTGR